TLQEEQLQPGPIAAPHAAEPEQAPLAKGSSWFSSLTGCFCDVRHALKSPGAAGQRSCAQEPAIVLEGGEWGSKLKCVKQSPQRRKGITFMSRNRALVVGLAFAALAALGAPPLVAADGISLTGLQPPAGVVHGPVGAIVNGNFNGPALDAQNSVQATVHYELDTANTGQVYVAIFDQPLLPRRILGVQNINKGAGNATVKFSLACTPGAPAMTPVHTIELGITRFGAPPPTTAPLPQIHKTH